MKTTKAKKSKPAGRITSIAISRLYNLGNYQNIKYDLAAEVAPGQKAGEVFAELHFILASLRPFPKPSCFDDYAAAIKKPQTIQSEWEKSHLEEWTENVCAWNERRRRRDEAVRRLDELGGHSFFKDAKTGWDNDEPF